MVTANMRPPLYVPGNKACKWQITELAMIWIKSVHIVIWYHFFRDLDMNYSFLYQWYEIWFSLLIFGKTSYHISELFSKSRNWSYLLFYGCSTFFSAVLKDGNGEIGELSVLWHGVHTTAQCSYSCGLAAGAKFCAFCGCTHRVVRRLLIFLLATHSNWYWVFGVWKGTIFLERISAIHKNRVTHFLIHSILCKTEWKFLKLFDCIQRNSVSAQPEKIINEWFHFGWYHILKISLWTPKKYPKWQW